MHWAFAIGALKNVSLFRFCETSLSLCWNPKLFLIGRFIPPWLPSSNVQIFCVFTSFTKAYLSIYWSSLWVLRIICLRLIACCSILAVQWGTYQLNMLITTLPSSPIPPAWSKSAALLFLLSVILYPKLYVASRWCSTKSNRSMSTILIWYLPCWFLIYNISLCLLSRLRWKSTDKSSQTLALVKNL